MYTLRKEDVKRLEGIKMWLWKRIEGIIWEDSVANEVGQGGLEKESCE